MNVIIVAVITTAKNTNENSNKKTTSGEQPEDEGVWFIKLRFATGEILADCRPGVYS
jgi:hypothetical protein